MNKLGDNIDSESRRVKSVFGFWEQTEDEVNLVVDLPEKCRAKDISVVCTPSNLTIEILRQQVGLTQP